MAICIIVLKDEASAYELSEKVCSKNLSILKFELIRPHSSKKVGGSLEEQRIDVLEHKDSKKKLKKSDINDVKLLNPKLSRGIRQRRMASWLMPFGFIAGLTFAGMTNLSTFSRLGLGNFGEIIVGGLLGMFSGLIGSYFGSASVNPYQQDIANLRKFNEKGLWLLLLQTPLETEPPWSLIKEVEPIELVSINEL